MGRDHSETCNVCGFERGGMNDAPCLCDRRATDPTLVELARVQAERDRLAAEVERLRSNLIERDAQLDAARATIGAECVEHVELNGHIDIAEQAHDYLVHEANDDLTGKLHDFAAALRIVIDQVDRQRRRANWYEVGYTAGKTKLIEYAVSVALEKARVAAVRYAARIDDLALAVDDSDPRVMACAEPIGAAQYDLWHALGMPDCAAPPCKGEPHTCDQEAIAAAEAKTDRLIAERDTLRAELAEMRRIAEEWKRSSH